MFACETIQGATGVTRDGGYATHMVAHASALVHVPDSFGAVDAAPLLCAGMTTFNSLRHCGASPADLIAICGLGGLGHLGVQYAARQGYRTVAIDQGRDREALARSGRRIRAGSDATAPAAR
jgi:alcohol dehydrogenase